VRLTFLKRAFATSPRSDPRFHRVHARDFTPESKCNPLRSPRAVESRVARRKCRSFGQVSSRVIAGSGFPAGEAVKSRSEPARARARARARESGKQFGLVSQFGEPAFVTSRVLDRGFGFCARPHCRTMNNRASPESCVSSVGSAEAEGAEKYPRCRPRIMRGPFGRAPPLPPLLPEKQWHLHHKRTV